jgi:hypothetical protein
VGGFFSAFQAQRNAAKIGCIHSRKYATGIETDSVGSVFLLVRADEFQDVVLQNPRIQVFRACIFLPLAPATPDCLYDRVEHSSPFN